MNRIFRFLQLLFIGASLLVLGWSSYSVAHYFRTAFRFEVRQLSVSGLKRVKENQVLARANFDIGTNVFAVDLEDMRQRVEQLPWVRQALVHRVLPDEIIINVVEREPIGLARIHGEIYEFDADGAILSPDPLLPGSFPILDGLQVKDDEANLEKVGSYSKVVEELGQAELSEVHVNDRGEVSVVSLNESVEVNLGVEDFHVRWIKYLQLKAQIQQQFPDAIRVDLRFRNQIIVRM